MLTLSSLFSSPVTCFVLTFGRFGRRRSQILDLTRLISPLDSPALPIIIYGDASTGKTSVVLQFFRHLNRPFVYSSCCTCCNPRILFESILNQLSLHSKNSSNGYASAKRDATSHLISSTYLNKQLDPWEDGVLDS
ncbi:unnamed protein product [Brassica rapa]|uniref:Orc1-like AAA ATPase domain-containing protein n=2 Tax=Brassica TaxID=3705 RepID=A0A8D9D0M6_BRACM|nr:unnamed protein product [Brassica napus]CAG7865794.1 unnamed protein product [Brassica rapa]